MLAVAYVIFKPRSPDLAAHIFRAELFGREGFTIWNGQWYGGHHTPAYSILSPPLVWLLGAAGHGRAVRHRRHRLLHRAGAEPLRAAALPLGRAVVRPRRGVADGDNRLPFALGAAFGLASALALQRDRRLLAPVLAVLAAISSPVAGLFVAMAGTAYGLAARGEGVPLNAATGPPWPRAG